MRKPVFALLLPLFLLLTSCSKEYDFKISVGEQIVLDLKTPGMGTGCSWQWEKKDDIVDTFKREFISYDENFIGGPGIEQWTFVGKRKGTTRIKMTNKRPWENEIIDSRVYNVKVRK